MNKEKSNGLSRLRRLWSYPAGKFVGIAIIGCIVVGLVAPLKGESFSAFRYAQFVGMAITMAAGVWFFIRAASGRNH